MDFQYKYIILGSKWDLYLNAYKDAINHPDIEYHSSYSKNILDKLVSYFHLHNRINSVINLPFKKIWAKKLIKITNPKFELNNICFIVFYGWICNNFDVLETIKKQYPKAKIVVIFNDLIKAQTLKYTNEPLDIDYIKKASNLVITFDFKEADEYGLAYHHVPYSMPDYDDSLGANADITYDVYFLGQAKNRLPQIMDAYFKLVKQGLKVNFILSNVPKKDRQIYDGITYTDGMGISYYNNLKNVSNSRCLLEIMQQNGSGYTLRTSEAIAYGKRLISNNEFLKRAPFYNPQYIAVTSSFNDLTPKFIADIKEGANVDYNYIHELSPIKLIEFIESKLKS